jgi:hypothetical protein
VILKKRVNIDELIELIDAKHQVMEIEECVELIKKLLFPKDVIFKFIRKSINA